MLLLSSLLLSQLIMLITFQVSFLLPKYVLKNPEKMVMSMVNLYIYEIVILKLFIILKRGKYDGNDA